VKILVIAKAPVAGSVKTRLCPPCTPEQAAELAISALRDTMDAVAATPEVEPILILDGEPGAWIHPSFAVVRQRGHGLDERLAAAFEDGGAPALLIGMDTPQVTPEMLASAVAHLSTPGVDAVLGTAEDGGWWAIGLRAPNPQVFLGVPMSTSQTGAAQRARLDELALDVADLPVLRDVDDLDDAVAVAASAPGSRFAAAVSHLDVENGAMASRQSLRAGTIAVLGIVSALILAANLRGNWLRSNGSFLMWVNSPPLTGTYNPMLSLWALVTVSVGLTGVWFADRVVTRVSWRRLLWASFGAALVWALALAVWDGAAGIVGSTRMSEDYAQTVPLVGDDPAAFVRTYVTDLRTFSTHPQAHPPGMVLLLWGMDRLGLGSEWWQGVLQLGVGAASVPAVLLTVREVGDDRLARAASPFLVLGPTAVAWSSGDAVFLGVGAWATAWLVLATGRTGRRADVLALAGGFAGGLSMLLSYGIVLLALVPAVVIIARRRWRVLAFAGVGVAAPLGLAWAAGFSWSAGLRATRVLYHQGIALRRPQSYFVWANIAALAVAVGPATWVGLSRLRDRGVWLLAGAAAVAIAIADLSGLSKAEVERIWLPFTPWLLAGAGVGLATVASRGRRAWLGTQVGWAIAVQLLVRSAT
jgi:rSAM/selenodomain-associated transferase 1